MPLVSTRSRAILSQVQRLAVDTSTDVLLLAVSEDAATTILDLSATMGVDFLMLGTSHRLTLANLLRGNVVTNIAAQLPDTIRLLIYG